MHAEDYELAPNRIARWRARSARGRTSRRRPRSVVPGRRSRRTTAPLWRARYGTARGCAAAAPGRLRRAAALDAVDRGDTMRREALLPVAAATAVDAARADSLLFVYGMTLVRVRECSTAVRVFEGVIRRQRVAVVAESRARDLASARWPRGNRAGAGPPGDAEGWSAAPRRRPHHPTWCGDVPRSGGCPLAQGDNAGAMESYQQALAAERRADTIHNGHRKAEPIRKGRT